MLSTKNASIVTRQPSCTLIAVSQTIRRAGFETGLADCIPSSLPSQRCIVPGWFWIILCTLTVTTVSFVLGSRVWAIYERDRRVLAGLLVGFMACFVPSWTLTFLAGVRGSLDADQLRVWGNVWLYMGGILMQDGLDGLDWRLRKCYRFPFPRATNSIVIGSLIYESTSASILDLTSSVSC